MKTFLQVAVIDIIAQVHGACSVAEEDKVFVIHCLCFVFWEIEPELVSEPESIINPDLVAVVLKKRNFSL